MAVNYHFDNKTLPQLIHLLKGQTLDLKDVDWKPPDSELWLRLRRDDPPNQGNYRIRIRGVREFRIHPEGGVAKARVEGLALEDDDRGFTLSGVGFLVSVRVEYCAVSALGET